MRVYKIAETFEQWGQPTEVIDRNLSIEEKHELLKDIQSDDILYIQKWRSAFNAVEHLKQYKGKCKIVFDLDDNTGDKQALELVELSDALVVGNHWLHQKFDDGTKPVIIAPSPVDILEYPKFTVEGPSAIAMAKCGIKPMLGPLKRKKELLDGLNESMGTTLILGGFQKPEQQKEMEELFPYATCYKLQTYDQYLKEMVPALQKATVGILPFTKRDQGKSGHSALANLAMGVPTCASPFAECDKIIQDGVNGFLASNPKEWKEKLAVLMSDAGLRQSFRCEGWKTIINKYDVPIIARKLLEDLGQV